MLYYDSPVVTFLEALIANSSASLRKLHLSNLQSLLKDSQGIKAGIFNPAIRFSRLSYMSVNLELLDEELADNLKSFDKLTHLSVWSVTELHQEDETM